MDQLDIFGQSSNPVTKSGLTVIENGEYLFFPGYFNKLESDSIFKKLRQGISWNQESMNLYGKRIDFPRLTAWYGDNDKPYSFSGITLRPHPWNEDLLTIKGRVEQEAKVQFNSVLLNLYRNGQDSISWHTDAEKELGVNPTIGSVNFGATRSFQLRHIKTKKKIEIELSHGSLLIMRGELQHYWQHQIPKTAKPVKERINLTFRVIH